MGAWIFQGKQRKRWWLSCLVRELGIQCNNNIVLGQKRNQGRDYKRERPRRALLDALNTNQRGSVSSFLLHLTALRIYCSKCKSNRLMNTFPLSKSKPPNIPLFLSGQTLQLLAHLQNGRNTQFQRFSASFYKPVSWLSDELCRCLWTEGLEPTIAQMAPHENHHRSTKYELRCFEHLPF